MEVHLPHDAPREAPKALPPGPSENSPSSPHSQAAGGLSTAPRTSRRCAQPLEETRRDFKRASKRHHRADPVGRKHGIGSPPARPPSLASPWASSPNPFHVALNHLYVYRHAHPLKWIFFCRGRLCRLIAVGHAVRQTKRTNYQQVKQMPHSVAQLPEPPSPVPPGVRR